jgi:hypothetical protein
MNLNDEKVETTHKIWNETTEKVIRDVETSCREYKYMHVQACKSASRKYDITMYIIIGLGPISSILASTYDTSANCNSPVNQAVQIFLYLITGVLSAIIKFSKFEHKATIHRTTSLKFSSLENNIKRQLTLSPEDRQPADKYLDWVIHSFDELFNSSPIIADTVFQKWSKERKDETEASKQHKEPTDPSKDPLHLCKEHSGICKENSEDKSTPVTTPVVNSVPSPRPQYPLEELEYNSFSDGKMNYELARLRRD